MSKPLDDVVTTGILGMGFLVVAIFAIIGLISSLFGKKDKD